MDGAFDGLDLAAQSSVCNLIDIAVSEWHSAVLVGVSVLTDQLMQLSTTVGVVDVSRDK